MVPVPPAPAAPRNMAELLAQMVNRVNVLERVGEALERPEANREPPDEDEDEDDDEEDLPINRRGPRSGQHSSFLVRIL